MEKPSKPAPDTPEVHERADMANRIWDASREAARKKRRDGRILDARQVVEAAGEGKYAETMGIEPSTFEREFGSQMVELLPDLNEFEQDGTDDQEIIQEFERTWKPEKIRDDLAEVRRRAYAHRQNEDELPSIERLGAQKERVYSMALEFFTMAMQRDWFPGCTVRRASRYDDYLRGIDLYVDLPAPGGGVLTIGLDVTGSFTQATEKLDKELEIYEEGRFHDVEYFVPAKGSSHGKGRAMVPRFVVGVSLSVIKVLAREYLEDELTADPAGEDISDELIHQVDLAVTLLKRHPDMAKPEQETRYRTLQERGAYLAGIQKALKGMRKDVVTRAAAARKRLGHVPRAGQENPVREAILARRV